VSMVVDEVAVAMDDIDFVMSEHSVRGLGW
jgi:hypothetical protein